MLYHCSTPNVNFLIKTRPLIGALWLGALQYHAERRTRAVGTMLMRRCWVDYSGWVEISIYVVVDQDVLSREVSGEGFGWARDIGTELLSLFFFFFFSLSLSPAILPSLPLKPLSQ